MNGKKISFGLSKKPKSSTTTRKTTTTNSSLNNKSTTNSSNLQQKQQSSTISNVFGNVTEPEEDNLDHKEDINSSIEKNPHLNKPKSRNPFTINKRLSPSSPLPSTNNTTNSGNKRSLSEVDSVRQSEQEHKKRKLDEHSSQEQTNTKEENESSTEKSTNDSIAKMEAVFQMKKASQSEENENEHNFNVKESPNKKNKKKLYKPKKSRTGKKHHLMHFLPNEKQQQQQQQQQQQSSSSSLDQSNVGYQMLEKMGWNGGEGLGKHKHGDTENLADTIQSYSGTQGIGHERATEESYSQSNDIYEQYKKRMMKAYKYRPNPLNNPRREY